MVYVTDSNESSSYIRIKFITPIEKDPNRKTTIKIFFPRATLAIASTYHKITP